MPVRVELVADSGPGIGLGHVGRLAALAEQLGPAAGFLVEDEHARRWLTDRGLHTREPGTPPGRSAADVVVLDRVAPVPPEEVTRLQAGGAVVALLDDAGPARVVADVVIDPPTLASWPPASGLVLQGFSHALLRREWAAARTDDSAREHVLLTFGGTDPYGLSAPAAAALAGLGSPVVTVLGGGSTAEVVGTVVRDPADFAAWVRRARLLVTAFGTTVLEAACVGTPVVAVCTRDDHLRDARGLEPHGLLRVVDARDGVPDSTWRDVVAAALDDVAWQADVRRRGPLLVDGHGAERVAAALLASVRSTDQHGPISSGTGDG
jgi:spore coat polysaccharide biosynthesis predicted glycosyltransferase SpsG